MEVIDFEGHHGNVTMKPGQMLLYESAKLIHGRPSILKAKRYVNCFAHYSPVDSTKWDFYHHDDVMASHSRGDLVDLKLY